MSRLRSHNVFGEGWSGNNHIAVEPNSGGNEFDILLPGDDIKCIEINSISKTKDIDNLVLFLGTNPSG